MSIMHRKLTVIGMLLLTDGLYWAAAYLAQKNHAEWLALALTGLAVGGLIGALLMAYHILVVLGD